MFLTIFSIPLVFYSLLSSLINVPKYLIFFILFTVYHLLSSIIINPVPSFSYWIWFLLLDKNFLACLIFFIIENTHFDERFIRIMNRNILIVVLISLLVSLIQIKYPSFFLSTGISLDAEDVIYYSQNRIFSIYSWLDLNSLGITFPILIAILLSFYNKKKKTFPLVVISGIVVSFLTKARYVMLSAIIVFSQLFFASKIKLRKKVYIFFIFAASIVIFSSIAKVVGYDIQQVIDERIMEKSSDMLSAKTRIISYYVFLKVFPDHPLFGVGPETKSNVVQLLGGSAPLIHVGYLSYLYFYGLVGSFLLLFSMFYLLKRTQIVGKKYEFWGGFYGLLSFFAANATMVYFNFSEMGIILVIIYIRYFSEKSSLELSELKL